MQSDPRPTSVQIRFASQNPRFQYGLRLFVLGFFGSAFGALCAWRLWPWIHSKFGANSNSGVDVLLTIAAGLLSFFLGALPLALIGTLFQRARHARQFSDFVKRVEMDVRRDSLTANVQRLAEFWFHNRLTPGQGMLATIEELDEYERVCQKQMPRIFVLKDLLPPRMMRFDDELVRRYGDSFRVYSLWELAGIKALIALAIPAAAFGMVFIGGGLSRWLATVLLILLVCGALFILATIRFWNLGKLHDGKFRWRLALFLSGIGVKRDGFGGLADALFGAGGTWIVRGETPVLEHRSRSGRVLIRRNLDPMRTLVLIDVVRSRPSERVRWNFVFPNRERYFTYDLNPAGTPWEPATDPGRNSVVII